MAGRIYAVNCRSGAPPVARGIDLGDSGTDSRAARRFGPVVKTSDRRYAGAVTIGKNRNTRRVLSESHLYEFGFSSWRKTAEGFILRRSRLEARRRAVSIGAAVMGHRGFAFPTDCCTITGAPPLKNIIDSERPQGAVVDRKG